MMFIRFLLISLFYKYTVLQSIGDGDKNIAFDTADLTLDYETDNRIIQLQAFKSVNNDLILSQNNASKHGQLQWFSIGYPRLIILSNDPISVFRFNPEGFTIEVSMVTDALKQEFVKVVQNKYNLNISPNQIVNLVPSEFKCSLKFYGGNEKMLLTGSVKQFSVFPIQIQFDAPIDTKERITLEKRIETDCKKLDLSFECQIGSHGRVTRVNTLIINADQINQLGLVDDLFGPADSVYVTRTQMADLATKLYNRLNIIEDYQIPESAFSTEFLRDFLEQTSNLINKYEPVDQVLPLLSPFNLQVDWTPDKLNSEYGKLFKVVSNGTKSHIILDKEHYEHLKEKSSESGSVGLSGSGWGVSIGGTAGYAKEKEKDWAKSGKNVDDQLKDLNNYENNEIEWKYDGEKIVAKSIKVSRLLKSKFSKAINLNRIRREYYNNKFNQMITLSTLNSYFSYDLSRKVEDSLKKLEMNAETVQKQLFDMKVQRYPYGSIIAVSSKKVLESFNTNGIGFGEYLGWVLCDGRNNSPDLRGRTLVGFDSRNSDYNQIGRIGGTDYVTLSVNQMPRHSHYDSGHSHNINLATGIDGHHTHIYKDVWFSEQQRGNHDYTSVPDGVGLSKAGVDNDNSGWQMTRTTNGDGYHYHKVSGDTRSAQADISYTGGSERIENRQPYFVVSYIVYLGSL